MADNHVEQYDAVFFAANAISVASVQLAAVLAVRTHVSHAPNNAQVICHQAIWPVAIDKPPIFNPACRTNDTRRTEVYQQRHAAIYHAPVLVRKCRKNAPEHCMGLPAKLPQPRLAENRCQRCRNIFELDRHFQNRADHHHYDLHARVINLF
jgi:hypothetical protein